MYLLAAPNIREAGLTKRFFLFVANVPFFLSELIFLFRRCLPDDEAVVDRNQIPVRAVHRRRDAVTLIVGGRAVEEEYASHLFAVACF